MKSNKTTQLAKEKLIASEIHCPVTRQAKLRVEDKIKEWVKTLGQRGLHLDASSDNSQFLYLYNEDNKNMCLFWMLNAY